ncbi:MAG: hypothetical protein COA47_09825 [Robiginitomaculum sp.]|nr:MAG: hypothetical protein COA47_09825 [Robiginitomaculum sp.]
MILEEIGKLAAIILLSMGGAAVLFLGISKWIGDLLGNRIIEKLKSGLQTDLESYKIKLRKSEFLFQKQYEAASEFTALYQNIIPRRSSPDMDIYEAYEIMATKTEEIEELLIEYRTKHSVILNKTTLTALSSAIAQASECGYSIANNADPKGRPEDISADIVVTIKGIWEKLELIYEETRQVVLDQSET